MFENVRITLDPSRPISKSQVENNTGFLLKLLGLSSDCIYFKKHNENYAIWAKYFENWDQLDFGVDFTDIANSLVIGYEMSPGFIKFCLEKEIIFISLNISPIRFFDDLLISYKTNLKIDELNITGIDDKIIRDTAKLKIESYRAKPDLYDIDGDIIVEQLPLDSSTILDGRFLGLEDVVKYFSLDKFRVLKHPFSKIWSFNGISGDPYRIMAICPNIKLYGISSSLLSEAKYFNISSYKIIDSAKDTKQNVLLNSGTLDISGVQVLRQFLYKYTQGLTYDTKLVKDALGFNWSRK